MNLEKVSKFIGFISTISWLVMAIAFAISVAFFEEILISSFYIKWSCINFAMLFVAIIMFLIGEYRS